MNKRVHQIAKERGLAPKEVLERLKAAGLEVKAASSSVDEAQARRILGDGDGAGQKPAPAAEKPARSDGDGGSPRS
ncbi:MAG: translation initiation factor IF-2 N-terminal domain-containing protein, partial [Solirubrobacteraceae bacterium]